MNILVYCSHHSLYGNCTQEDWDDAESGRNPSRMVRVNFENFTQAVPFHTISKHDPLKVRKELRAQVKLLTKK